MSAPSPLPPVDELSRRLADLRQRIARVPPGPSSELGDIRGILEASAAEADVMGRPSLGEVLRRVGLLLEVWECLAYEGSESTAEVAAFCTRAIEQLEESHADPDGSRSWTWIFTESSTNWPDYLGLLEPQFSGSLMAGADPAEPAAPEDDYPSIDPAALLRLLGGSPPGDSFLGFAPAGAPRPAEVVPAAGLRPAVEVPEPKPRLPEPPPAPSAEPPFEIPPAPTHLDLDPEIREVFLSEVTELFERAETLVLQIGRGDRAAEGLHELGRCLHTLKGASGSVGLVELSSLVHLIENRLTEADGVPSAPLLDLLHKALGYFDGIADALRGKPGPSPQIAQRDVAPPRTPSVEPARTAPPPSVAADFSAPRPPTVTSQTASPGAQSANGGSIDGPVRVASARVEELMDLASELVSRRGLWAAHSERVKELATMARTCRNRLSGNLDRLHAVGVSRDGAGAEIQELLRRLAEQADDLAVLAEVAQATAIPLADNGDALSRLTLQLWESLQAIQIVPIRALFQRLARVARDAAQVEGRQVEVTMLGEETGLDRAVQDKAFEPLLHVVRNAVGHGIESAADRERAGKAPQGRVTLEARRDGNTLVLCVHDDGRGLDYAAIAEKGRRVGLIAPGENPGIERLNALVFHPGFSTRQEANAISGRGIGMDVVAREVGRLNGTIELSSRPGLGTTLTIRLPARLALEQAMLIRIGGRAYAFPLGAIEHAQQGESAAAVSPGTTIRIRDRECPLIDARSIFGAAGTPPSCPKLLLVRTDGDTVALLVDAIDGTRELVVRPLNALLAGHPLIAGTSLSLSGEVILVINPAGLTRWWGRRAQATAAMTSTPPPASASILVVDDSISVRRVVARHLRALGLEVEEVSNGIEALSRLRSRSYNMLLTDLEMPRMDGFELLAELGRLDRSSPTPVVVASSKCDPETRRRVFEQGARAFIAKPVEPHELARTVGQLALAGEGRAQSIVA